MANADDMLKEVIRNPEQYDNQYIHIDKDKVLQDAAKFASLRSAAEDFSKNADVIDYFDNLLKDLGITLTDEQHKEALRSLGEGMIGHTSLTSSNNADFFIFHKDPTGNDISYYSDATLVTVLSMGILDHMGHVVDAGFYRKAITRLMLRERDKLWTGKPGSSGTAAEFDAKFKKADGTYKTGLFMKGRTPLLGSIFQSWLSITAMSDVAVLFEQPLDLANPDDADKQIWQLTRFAGFYMAETADFFKALGKMTIARKLESLKAYQARFTPGSPEFIRIGNDIASIKNVSDMVLGGLVGSIGRVLNMYGAAVGIYRQVAYNLGKPDNDDASSITLIVMSALFGAGNFLSELDILSGFAGVALTGNYESMFFELGESTYYTQELQEILVDVIGAYLTSALTNSLKLLGYIAGGLIIIGALAMLGEQIMFLTTNWSSATVEMKVAMSIEMTQVGISTVLAVVAGVLMIAGELAVGGLVAIAAMAVVALSPTQIEARRERMKYVDFLNELSDKYKPYGYDGDATLADLRQNEADQLYYAPQMPIWLGLAAATAAIIAVIFSEFLVAGIIVGVGLLVFAAAVYYALWGFQDMLEDQAQHKKAEIEKEYGSVANYVKRGITARINYFFDTPEVKAVFRQHLDTGEYERVLGATTMGLDRQLRELSAVLYSADKVPMAISQAREMMDDHYANVDGVLNTDTNVFNLSTHAKSQYVFIIRQLGTPSEKTATRFYQGWRNYQTELTYVNQEGWKVYDNGMTRTVFDARFMATTIVGEYTGGCDLDKHLGYYNNISRGRSEDNYSEVIDGVRYDTKMINVTMTQPSYYMGWGDDTVISGALSSMIDGGEGEDSVDYSSLFFEGTYISFSSTTDGAGKINASNPTYGANYLHLTSKLTDAKSKQVNGITITATDDKNDYTVEKNGWTVLKEEYTAKDTVTYGKRVEHVEYTAFADVMYHVENKDVLTSIKRIGGTLGSDKFTGLGADDYFRSAGFLAFDNDVLDGGDGFDTVDYRGSMWQERMQFDIGISADLQQQSVKKAVWNSAENDAKRLNAARSGLDIPDLPAVDNTGRDVVTNFEGVVGTASSDVIRGNDNDNHLVGLAGDDWISGEGGSDFIQAGNGTGKAGRFTHLDGGGGDDYFQITGTRGTFDIIVGKGVDYLDLGTSEEINVRVNGIQKSVSRVQNNIGVTVNLAAGTANAMIQGDNYNVIVTADMLDGSRYNWDWAARWGFGSGDDVNLFAADVNGDGIMDLLRQKRTDDAYGKDIIQFYLGDGKGGFTKFGTDVNGNTPGINAGYLLGKDVNIYVGDFNGDHLADVFRLEIEGPDGNYVSNAQILFGNGQGGLSLQTNLNSNRSIPNLNPMMGQYINVIVGDFNGDGKDDFIRHKKSDWVQADGAANFQVYFSKGDGTFTKAIVGPTDNSSTIDGTAFNGNYVNLFAGDFNGDGKADILRQEKGTWADNDNANMLSVYIGDGAGGFSKAATDGSGNANGIGNAQDFNGNKTRLYVADFNGDGFADILRQRVLDTNRNTKGSLQLYYGDGSGGFVKAPLDVNNNLVGMQSAYAGSDSYKLLVGKFTRGPYADIVRQGTGADPERVLQLYKNDDGAAFRKLNPSDYDQFKLAADRTVTLRTRMGVAWTLDQLSSDNAVLRTGDFNGDGFADILKQGTADVTADGAQIWLGQGNGTFILGKVQPDGNAPLLGAYATKMNYIVGDFNGDGYADLMRQEKGAWAPGGEDLDTVQILFNDKSGSFYQGPKDPATRNIPNILPMVGDFVNVIAADFNGDGKADFLRQEKGTYATDGKNIVVVYMSNGDGTFTLGASTVTSSGNAIGTSSDFSGDNATLYAGDFNGDGKADILRQETSASLLASDDNNIQVYLGDAKGGFVKGAFSSSGNAVGLSGADFRGDKTKLYIGDFNGDGKADILRQRIGVTSADKTSTVSVFIGNGDGSFIKAPTDTQGNIYGLPWSSFNGDIANILVGKFTGSRYFDVVRQGKVGDRDGVLQFFQNDRKGSFLPIDAKSVNNFKVVSDRSAIFHTQWGEIWDANLLSLDSAVLRTGDFNGDGITDILRQGVADVATDGAQIFYGQGNGVFTRGPVDANGNAQILGAYASKMNYIVGDFNGDGFDDLMRQEKGAWAPNGEDLDTVQILFNDKKGGFYQGPKDPDTRNIPGLLPMVGDFVNVITGDFNGDGKTDFLRQEKGSYATDGKNVISVYMSNGDGKFTKGKNTDTGSGNANGIGTASDFSGDNVNLYAGDFNGDGKTDILRQEKGNLAAETKNNIQVYLSDGMGGFVLGSVGTDGNAAGVDGNQLRGDLTRLYVGDYNGDGKADLIRQEMGAWTKDQSGAVDKYNMVHLFLGNGNGGFTGVPTDPDGNIKGLPWASFNGDTSQILVGKFTGSKYFDVLRQGKWGDTNGVLQFYQNDRQNSFLAKDPVLPPPDRTVVFRDLADNRVSFDKFNKDGAVLAVGDFNGDGIADILRSLKSLNGGRDVLTIWKGDGNGGFYLDPNTNDYGNLLNIRISGDHETADTVNYITGDFNGDGLTDIFRQEKGSIADDKDWTDQIWLNNGTKFNVGITGGGFKIPETDDMNGNYVNIIVGDFNGDGMDDIFRQEKKYWASDNWNTSNVWFSLGNGGLHRAEEHNQYFNATGTGLAGWSGDVYNLYAGDFNGDGKADILRQRLDKDEVIVFYSDGGGGFTQSTPGNAPGIGTLSISGYSTKLYVGDFNGDGKADFVRQETGSSDDYYMVQVFLGDGKGGFILAPTDDKGNMKGLTNIGWFNGGQSNILVGKFTGNKAFDILRQGSSNSPDSGFEFYRNDGKGGFDRFAETERGGTFSITGIESVRGTKCDDVLIGDDQNNTIAGYGGNDIIHGGGGKDTLIATDNDGKAQLFGEAGDDTIMIGGAKGTFYVDGGREADGKSGSDLVDFSLWTGGRTAHAVVDFTTGKALLSTLGQQTGTVYLTDIEGVRGTRGDDKITGDGGVNTLGGDEGNDEIWGNGGDDMLSGGDGHDVIHGGDGNDVIKDQAGNNKIYGDDGDDHILTDANIGQVNIDGGNGDDLIQIAGFDSKTNAHEGNYYINGGAGRDVLDLGAINLSAVLNNTMKDKNSSATRDPTEASYFNRQYTNVFTADFNGDGLTDILRQEKGAWGLDSTRTISVYLADGKGAFYRAETDKDYNAQGLDAKLFNGENYKLATGDFNGDGKADFLAQFRTPVANLSSTNIQMYFGDGKGGFKKGPVDENDKIQDLANCHGDFVNIIVADFNGDGKDDFARQEKGAWATDNYSMFNVWLSNGDGTFKQGSVIDKVYNIAVGWTPLNANGDYNNLYAGDFNGDGYADILRQEKSDLAKDDVNMLMVYMGDGTGGFSVGELNSLGNANGITPQDFNGDTTKLYIADFNGDGKSDILKQKFGTAAKTDAKMIQIFLSDGRGGFTLSATANSDGNVPSFIAQDFFGDDTTLLLGDFSGNGKADITRINNAVTVDTFFNKGDGTFFNTKNWARTGRGVDIDLRSGTGYAYYAPPPIDSGGSPGDKSLIVNVYGQRGKFTITNVEDLRGTDGIDRLVGNDDSNAFDGMEGDDELYGMGGNDTLLDEQGNNKLFGGDGNDLLSTGDGNDELDGGAGNDTLEGGDGNDRFIFTLAGGFDWIDDFKGVLKGGHDVMQIDSRFYRKWEEVVAAMTQDKGDVIITLNPTAGIRVVGTKIEEISRADIVFA